ncbi:MAG: TonB-dependent receptor plug domain-containing protein, partial [Gallionellaceae bacterium]
MQFKRITICVALAFAPSAFAAETLPEVPVRSEALQPLPSTNNRGLEPESLKSKRAGTSDTASLLEDVPGVSLYGAGGVSSLPAIHGLADDRLRIKVDGMDLISACGNHMNPPLSYIDPSSVGSIKVFAGIAPVSLGGDSIGGTVQVESAMPKFSANGETLLSGELGAFYRSNGNAQGGNLAATIASETLSLTYTGSTAKSDDYKAGGDFKQASYYANAAAAAKDAGDRVLGRDEVGSSMYKSTNQSLALALRNANHLFEFKLGVQDIPYQGWPNQRMDMTGNDSKQFNLRYTGDYGWGKLEGRAYHEHTRHKMQFFDDKLYWYGAAAPGNYTNSGTPCVPSATCAAGMPMDTDGKNSGVTAKASILMSERDLLRIGAEAQQYRLNDWWDPSGKGMWPSTFWNINGGQRDRMALFGEWEANWNPQWLTQFGVRHEAVDMNTGTVQGYSAGYVTDATAFNNTNRKKTDHNWDLTALARFTPSATQTYEFGFAQKTRSPNLYERYTWSKGGMAMYMINMAGDGNGYVGNLNLKPEVAHTLSATADWHGEGAEDWSLKVTPYYTQIQDYIDAQRCSAGSTVCVAANLTRTNGYVFLQFVNQRARLYGMDISGRMPLAKSEGYGDLTATAVISYVDGKNQTTGDNLYNIMPLNARLAVSQRLAGWTNTAEIELVDAKTQ